MRKNSAVLLLFVTISLVTPMMASAGLPLAPEIDPASARGGLALVMASAALILERRRRR